MGDYKTGYEDAIRDMRSVLNQLVEDGHALPEEPRAILGHQPTYTDERGVRRFRKNAIVRFLLDAGPFDMNQLAAMDFTDDDRAQFAQLIGYTVGGWTELSYVTEAMYQAAMAVQLKGTEVDNAE